jgi:hypothetical protein
MKNIAGKTRKSNNPYASWTDLRTGWKYKLLKSWQGDNGAIYARWFVDVEGYGHDLGDEYVSNMKKALVVAEDLEFDKTIWPNCDSFLEWAWGVK